MKQNTIPPNKKSNVNKKNDHLLHVFHGSLHQIHDFYVYHTSLPENGCGAILKNQHLQILQCSDPAVPFFEHYHKEWQSSMDPTEGNTVVEVKRGVGGEKGGIGVGRLREWVDLVAILAQTLDTHLLTAFLHLSLHLSLYAS